MLTTFGLTSMGRIHIPAREYQFQSYGRIDMIQEPYHVRLMRHKFSHTVEPDVEFKPDNIADQRTDVIRYGIIQADEQENGEAREEEENFHYPGDDSCIDDGCAQNAV
jgi:hypothetical protein